ncbi:hypothetical protein A2774_01195 [Candidatus Roizmanbacteria bacterium RIFCSPHIGHO2_01_FULL_39_12c]|uniref:DUF2970 domain-containing protein n=1 Tax=Candidatus Roizmanbacteria bacterium RIFCSPHIGHO2_01_FULL_39_12c TaxID=1802031 RepID=A0A1F7G7W4_9BACT|nr:MAG: hypothetical protein A2774_01195 [Candidatus Roizmanbacteria bacterium RIFCSPHIGHO2_01_FULL_39_12c]OGK46444.1 MAG: hypothetical protein A2963_01600 [Candidatus Roizmanbacteria bacterium RIFCSPLOWO2_01_FULL_40_13]
MDRLPFQILFLILCVTALAYLNRNNFGGPAQQVMGRYFPRPIIIGALCLFLGIFIWLVINTLLWRFG